ncbi:MAG: 2-C-methyl-D-erythritol 2,4-cyclodiphosphate synthase [Bacilli bacterium]|nr:2-C-methyl-D-erythritol 2,4-cyclodiphosphate synthase [Bacilli bacterium]
MYRIGQSSDIHKLVKDRKLILGGVEIKSEVGLLGHSDADALLHAIAEAIIGALALNDLGHHFPDNDDKYKDISSLKILEEVYKLMINNGYEIVNVDSLIMIENIKMKPYINMMKENIAKTLNTSINNVNVKATCAEKLGFIGKGEGVMAQAIVLLKKI